MPRRLRPVPGTAARRPSVAGRRRWSIRYVAVLMFAVAVLVIAGLGFTYKMSEFALTIVNDDVEGFGAVAVSVYLIGMVPIVFLTLWAVFTGKFRDIERPKFRMLELDREIERGGELGSTAGVSSAGPSAGGFGSQPGPLAPSTALRTGASSLWGAKSDGPRGERHD